MISALIQVATDANLDDEIRSRLKVDGGGEKEEAGKKGRSWDEEKLHTDLVSSAPRFRRAPRAG